MAFLSSTPSLMTEVVVRPTNGGNGLRSYSKNSTFQRKAIEAAKELINKAIAEKLDIKIFSSSNTFKIADLGCSVGPNTLLAVQNVIDAVERKFQSRGKSSQHPEFQVFFNDQASKISTSSSLLFLRIFLTLPPACRVLFIAACFQITLFTLFIPQLLPSGFLESQKMCLTRALLPHEKPQPNVMSSTLRAAWEGIIKEHFGDEILDELFDTLVCNELEESCKLVDLFVVLKRKRNE